MIPLTMKFSSRQPTIQLLSTGNAGYQVQTAYQLSAGEGPSFEVSGTGTLPALGEQAKFQAPSQSPTLPNPIVSAAGRSALPLLAIVDSRPKQTRSEEHTSELQSRLHLVCRLLLEKKKKKHRRHPRRSQTV